jgi:hypothetical protein
VEQRELEADAEAAPIIRKYLQLADVALAPERRPLCMERPKQDAGMDFMQLRIESGSGSPINDYRISNGSVEVRSLDSAGHPYPGAGSRWRVLDKNDIALHDALGTVVSKWLRVRLGTEAVALDRAA